MLIPSRTKYRRVHRLPYEGHAKVILNYTMELTDLWQWKVLG